MTFTLSDFDYILPERLIAHEPTEPREAGKLLHVGKGEIRDLHIRDLPSLLRPDDLMVFNDSKVIPARLYGHKQDSETRFEVLLHKSIDGALWEAWAKPSKKLAPGDRLFFADEFSAEIIGKTPEGPIHLRFDREGADLFAALHSHGLPPLPPYIKRAATARDVETYQTVYARHEGSVAAPTAGLHFTNELIARIDAMGIRRAHVTLHVGAGTFKPVQSETLSEHVMHAEMAEIDADTARLVNETRAKGGRIVAVGTTSTRVLESATGEDGVTRAFYGDTRLFITPGYRFRAVDALMTNFHLPKSTLLMLVSAFAGMTEMRDAYAHAIANEYRFFSYGDACFLEPSASSI